MAKNWKEEYIAAADLIERFAREEPERRYGEWDDFTSIPIKDPFLDRIRIACDEVHELYPPTKPGAFTSEAGTRQLLGLARELRERAAAP